MSLLSLPVDAARLQAQINELAAITEVAPPAVTRILFSPEDLAARAWLTAQCRELGLTVRLDAVGNLFARWAGSQPHLPAVASGSHIDAIPNAGRYDGVVGVLGVLEAFRALRAAGHQPVRSLELIQFTAEEPTRFGIGCLGSRLLSGALSAAIARELRDAEGRTLSQWLDTVDWPKLPLETVALPTAAYRAFLELHIEQGPILERDNLEIGVIEKIAAPSSFRFELTGAGGHAGGVLMPGRRDALLAGCEIALAVERACLESGSPDTVATTGVFQIEPGAINSIPFRARLGVDLRDTDVAARSRVLATIQDQAAQICARRRIEVRYEPINLDPPALADPALVELVSTAARELGIDPRRMISRAYHDSLFMALVCPTSMIFIPCRAGLSHHPDEYSSPEQIGQGVAVLAGALATLSSS